MNKHLTGRLSESVRQAVLGFDLHPAIVVGFALHWTWVWITFWSSKFYSASPLPSGGLILSLEPLWLLSIATNVGCYASLFFVSTRLRVFSRVSMLPWLAAALTVAGTVLISYPPADPLGEATSLGYIAGALITGIGSATEIILWAELLANRGARQVVVYSVLATVVGSLFYCVIMVLPGLVARLVTAVLPAVEMALFCRQRALVVNARVSYAAPTPADAAERRSLVEIGLVALFFGFSYGMMKGFFVPGSDELIAIRDWLNIAALILGALAVLLTMSVLRMDFRHMTYQVALPLMASGFVLFSLGYPLDLVGFAAHQMGYQYFYIIIWALWAVLSLEQQRPPAKYATVSMAAIMGGQLVGSVVGAHLVTVSTNPYHIAVVAACSVFVILLVALFAFESPFPGSDRAFFPVAAKEDEGAERKRSLESLAQSRGLSPRETEVLEFLAKGRNRSFISTQLVISEETTKTYIKRIYRKFGVHSQQALLDLIELDGAPHEEG